ncbi:MAG: hypothetical protein WCZ18_03855 [Ottowia sp.]|nr:hypothetical protein [Ottowia sp.]
MTWIFTGSCGLSLIVAYMRLHHVAPWFAAIIARFLPRFQAARPSFPMRRRIRTVQRFLPAH